MANNNGGGIIDGIGALVVIAFIMAMLAVLAIYFFVAVAAIAAFISFAWTFVCLIAWNRPFYLGRLFLHPSDARAFVIRGLFGAAVLPAFLLLCDWWLGINIKWQSWPYYVLGGYTLLSVGIEYLIARNADIPYLNTGSLPVEQTLAPREPYAMLEPPRPPRFASWDDRNAGP
jgi:hypothetical protein